MLYKDPSPIDLLEQGDLLKVTPSLRELLEKYHPYYASHADNRFFFVLTQSCDLVPRQGGIAAQYISIAPVRPLRLVLRRQFDHLLQNVEKGAQPYADVRTRNQIEQFLARLVNNNEPAHFYLDADQGRHIPEDMCAVLSLSISFKKEHYGTFVDAKLVGIEDVFQAKLGWLLGQMYGRVGTPDRNDADLRSKVAEYSESLALYLEEYQVRQLPDLIDEHRKAVPGAISRTTLYNLIKTIPAKKKRIIDAVLDVAASQGLVEQQGKKRFALRKALDNDSTLSHLIAGKQ